MKKDLFLFYIVRSLFLPFFWLPVLYIYLTQNKGLDPVQTMFLLGLQEFLLIFLEIPTGVIADKISRRFSVALGYVLTALPFALLPLFSDYWIFIVLFAIKAIGKACISGADTSLLYDLLLTNGKQDQYKFILIRSKAYMLAVAAIAMLLGGIIAETNIELTLILPFPLMLIGAVAVMLMHEPEITKEAKKIQEANFLKHTWSTIKFVFSKKSFLLVIAVFALVDATVVNMKWYYTPILSELKLDLGIIGGITSILYVGKALANYLGSKAGKSRLLNRIEVLMLVTTIVFAFMALAFNTAVVIAGLLIVMFATELLDALTDEQVQGFLQSHHRSTGTSILNQIGSIFATGTLFLFGVAQQNYGINGALLTLAGFFLIGTVLAVISRVRANAEANN